MDDSEQSKENAHLHDKDSGLKHGVPEGVSEEESKGLPNGERQQTESHPIHKTE